ncbi:4-coumarate--CoA ligase-like 9 [Acorus gramineus]|uniref:4-coumarate--CoA ligase n=1 Tax=Acorus gramineus TaxID=55184 RepID=A0AAV9ARP3_ACOGR|nr:4-coumarate--CoA ligase-like 9 [Acorus gramineus]
MAESISSSPTIDPGSGYCHETRTFHSLRSPAPLPPASTPLSVTSYVSSLHLRRPPPPGLAAVIESGTGRRLTYPEFASRVETLAGNLRSRLGLSKGDVAFVLAPACLEIPVLYYAILTVGAVVNPANPISTATEISRQIQLSRPVVAFATSASARALPGAALRTVLIDSDEFRSMMMTRGAPSPIGSAAEILQTDPAAILYSSGTTGRVKAAVLTHRNFISITAGYVLRRDSEPERATPPVGLLTVPLFHVFGFYFSLKMVALGETAVVMGRFEMGAALEAVERFRVTYMPVSPPLVVALLKSKDAEGRDLSSLEVVGCGGAPLGRDVAERFASKFPHVQIVQGYGLTESGGGATQTVGPEENQRYGSAGRIEQHLEAKIVDPETGEALGPGQRGELWLRGPSIMQGYLGDAESTNTALNPEGWLKTGDLCYFDQDGFLFVVDRLKELIKYKAYQVPPAELEHILQAHPEIADAAVVPYPDEESGQIPMAYIVRQPGSTLDEKKVIDYVAKQVAPYKKIRRVSFINAIPKSPAGKILRRDLVNLALSGTLSRL